MKIAVNTRLLLHGKLEGIGRFAHETLKILVAKHPEVEFIFLFDRPFNQEFIYGKNVTPVVIFPPARHPILFYWWFEQSVPRVLSKLKPDLFLSPDGYLSLNSDVLQLPVIHDLNFEHHPLDVPWYNRLHFRHYFPQYAKKAGRIATVSEFSAKDISQRYGVSRDKIDVVFNGVSSGFSPVDDVQKTITKAKYTGGKPYFLYWGSINPRKNIVNLMLAFEQFKKASSNDIQLVLAGSVAWWTSEMQQTLDSLTFKSSVHLPGRIPEDALNALVGSALAVTYIPYFEGFGIPVIEAFSAGVPVITANITSMPEVAGNAALLVNPFQPETIAQAMAKLAEDEALRFDLIKKGLERSRMFTWERTADLLWDSVEKTVGGV